MYRGVLHSSQGSVDSSSLVDLTQVKISTEAGASDAISIIDAALDKVAQMEYL